MAHLFIFHTAGVQSLFTLGAVLYSYFLACKLVNRLNIRISLDGEHHTVIHIGGREQHISLPVLIYAHTVPYAVYAVIVKLNQILVPNYLLALKRHAYALAHLARNVNIKAHYLVIVVFKAHGRKGGVQAQHQRISVLSAARKEKYAAQHNNA